MNDSSEPRSNHSRASDGKAPKGGGFFIAVGAIIGVFAGGFNGQPSAGLLIGLGVGVAIAALIWLFDRR